MLNAFLVNLTPELINCLLKLLDLLLSSGCGVLGIVLGMISEKLDRGNINSGSDWSGNIDTASDWSESGEAGGDWSGDLCLLELAGESGQKFLDLLEGVLWIELITNQNKCEFKNNILGRK